MEIPAKYGTETLIAGIPLRYPTRGQRRVNYFTCCAAIVRCSTRRAVVRRAYGPAARVVPGLGGAAAGCSQRFSQPSTVSYHCTLSAGFNTQ